MKAKIIYREDVPVGFKVTSESEDEAVLLKMMGVINHSQFKAVELVTVYVSEGIGEMVLIKQ